MGKCPRELRKTSSGEKQGWKELEQREVSCITVLSPCSHSNQQRKMGHRAKVLWELKTGADKKLERIDVNRSQEKRM